MQLKNIVSGEEIKLEALSGKTIAIDAMNTLYQFISIIRQKDGTPLMDSRGRVTSHLSGILYRNAKLLESGITPVYVFDGKPPALKRAVIEERKSLREASEEKWKKALEEGRIEEARKHAQAASRLTGGMIEDSKKLLDAMGISWVQAPGEGEAQASYMCSSGAVHAAGSQDYDSLLFGTNRLVRNINVTGKRKLPGKEVYVDVFPEMIELEKIFHTLGINREQLVAIGILVGTDFNPDGIRGIGPKKALQLVREHKTLDRIVKQVEWTESASAEEIAKIFLEPDVSDEYEIKARPVDEGAMVKLLCEEHDFSEERIRKVVQEITKTERKEGQKSLGHFF